MDWEETQMRTWRKMLSVLVVLTMLATMVAPIGFATGDMGTGDVVIGSGDPSIPGGAPTGRCV